MESDETAYENAGYRKTGTASGEYGKAEYRNIRYGNAKGRNIKEEREEIQVISGKRNPYLVDYEQQLAAQNRMERNRKPRRTERYGKTRRGGRKTEAQEKPRRVLNSAARQQAAARRRRIVRMQRLALGAGVVTIALLCILFVRTFHRIRATGSDQTQQQAQTGSAAAQSDAQRTVQGLPAEEFAKHPDWEENFLTLNEYSRPGDALPEVKSIFVHYTANINTSAAQNRSYFEQLKDTHDRSASAHFIIGYNGEIIQCIPLDEIAYAVQTRNFDSVSIECCYKSENGAFTQETYDSLIDLLAWLTEAYDLDTDDILRHYDCGGKKCPLYYTEHEDAWKKLKSDVAAKLNL